MQYVMPVHIHWSAMGGDSPWLWPAIYRYLALFLNTAFRIATGNPDYSLQRGGGRWRKFEQLLPASFRPWVHFGQSESTTEMARPGCFGKFGCYGEFQALKEIKNNKVEYVGRWGPVGKGPVGNSSTLLPWGRNCSFVSKANKALLLWYCVPASPTNDC